MKAGSRPISGVVAFRPSEATKTRSVEPVKLSIDYFQHGGGKALEFWWQPPGEQLRPVPPGVLSP